MNNEPIAWYKENSNDYLIENIGQPSFQVQEFIDAGYIPLYTHPPQEPNCYGDGNVYRGVRSKDSEVQIIHIGGVRELTDEEIDLIAKPFLENMEGYSYYGESLGISEDRYIEFARAILKKASEK